MTCVLEIDNLVINPNRAADTFNSYIPEMSRMFTQILVFHI